jgi:uncharacterized protein (TIGR03067 family)
MFTSKLKTMAAVILATAVLITSAAGLTAPHERKLPSPKANVLTAAAPAAHAQQGELKKHGKDKETLQGAWHLVGVTFQGEAQPKDLVEAVENSWVVDGDKIKETARGKVRDLTMRLDPGQQPKCIDLTIVGGTDDEFFPGGSKKGDIVRGIYRLNGDKLTICLNPESGQDAPKDFAAEKDSPFVMYVFKRGKAAKPAAPRDLPGELAVGANKLRQIGLALFRYEDDHGRLPSAALCSKEGKPLLSWRVAVLPYLDDDCKALYDEFKLDEPWDSAHNKTLIDKMPHYYRSPSAQPKDRHSTFYQVFVAKSTAFDLKEGRKIEDINDLASTVLVVEAAEPVAWTKPQDLTYDGAKPLPKLGGAFRTGFHALMGFERTYFILRNDLDELSFRREIERAKQ